MKSNIALVFVVISLAVALIALVGLKSERDKLMELEKRFNSAQQGGSEQEEHHELAEYMQHLQWYSNKLYFSGMAGNKELSEFYLHELEEVMEEIIDAKIIDEGKSISTLMQTYGLNQLERVADQMPQASQEEFKEQYHSLIESCNSCHVVSDHRFIKIIEPTVPIADNQSFVP